MEQELTLGIEGDVLTAPTALALMDVAEELFALNGYYGASVRDITAQAKANLGAVTYHFGTKENLLKAILHRGASKLLEERTRRFDEIERSRAKPKLEDVIRAFIEPAYALAATPHGVRFLRVQNDISAGRTEIPGAILQEYYDPSARRCMRLLGKAVPQLEAETLLWYFQFMLGALLYTLTQPKRFSELRDLNDGHARELSEFVRFVSNALKGRASK